MDRLNSTNCIQEDNIYFNTLDNRIFGCLLNELNLLHVNIRSLRKNVNLFLAISKSLLEGGGPSFIVVKPRFLNLKYNFTKFLVMHTIHAVMRHIDQQDQ